VWHSSSKLDNAHHQVNDDDNDNDDDDDAEDDAEDDAVDDARERMAAARAERARSAAAGVVAAAMMAGRSRGGGGGGAASTASAPTRTWSAQSEPLVCRQTGMLQRRTSEGSSPTMPARAATVRRAASWQQQQQRRDERQRGRGTAMRRAHQAQGAVERIGKPGASALRLDHEEGPARTGAHEPQSWRLAPGFADQCEPPGEDGSSLSLMAQTRVSNVSSAKGAAISAAVLARQAQAENNVRRERKKGEDDEKDHDDDDNNQVDDDDKQR
jgi:hypothetical protein